MLDPKKRTAIEHDVAQSSATKCGDKANNKHANRVKFVLLRADESRNAKGNDADGFDEWDEFNDGGWEHFVMNNGWILNMWLMY